MAISSEGVQTAAAGWPQPHENGAFAGAVFVPHTMDLTGQLSNPPETLVHLFSILSRPTKRTKKRSTKPKKSGYVEGRRRFGSVGKAVLAVLAAADRELTAHEIRLHADKLLGSPVSPHSIAYQLQAKSKGAKPTIIQTGRRYYRLGDSS